MRMGMHGEEGGLYREYVSKPVTTVLWDRHKERFGP
jgi:hypothetical protein